MMLLLIIFGGADKDRLTLLFEFIGGTSEWHQWWPKNPGREEKQQWGTTKAKQERSGRKRKEEDFYDRSREENILYFYAVSLQVVSDHCWQEVIKGHIHLPFRVIYLRDKTSI